MRNIFRWIVGAIVAVMAVFVPFWIYIAFFAEEPVFAVEQDIALGQQTAASIADNPDEYPILPEAEYPEAYAHLHRIVDSILAAEAVEQEELFPYELRIIDDDTTLNAFCAPGGYIYVYTGIIRYLDAEDHLAGVLGHEIAHAERRHSAQQLQREYGTQKLLEFTLLTTPMSVGDAIFAAIARDLTNLKYGRAAEAEADAFSVRYLADTPYACDGAAGFFEKLINEGADARIPEWLSSHPDSAARIREVRRMAGELGCSTDFTDPMQWESFRNSLPAIAVNEGY